MTFAESLKQYMTEIPCSASELSAVSGLAPSMISRYLRSEQLPGEKAVRKLAAGLDFLARDKGGMRLNLDKITQALMESLYGISIDYSLFIKNLQTLLGGLNINKNELAKSLNFDPSYISRILAGTRKPANLYQFLNNISDFITKRFFDTPYVSVIANITECDMKELLSKELLSFNLRRYLGSHTDSGADILLRFLVNLDTFDMNEYRMSLKNSALPNQKTTKISSPSYYYGLNELKRSYTDFLDRTYTYQTGGDVILFRDIPSAEITQSAGFSPEFSEKMLRLIGQNFVGPYIHSIIDVHRSLGELLHELYQWLPFYIAGKVRLYYFNEPTNHTFMHFLCSSDAACVEGEAVFGNPNNCRCRFSTELQDIQYTKDRAEELLSHSRTLIDVYDLSRRDEYSRDKFSLFTPGDDYLMLQSVPPFFAMSPSLLERILERVGISESEASEIRSHHTKIKEIFESIVSKGSIHITLPKTYTEKSAYLSLPGLFRKDRIEYTRSEYEEHIRDLKDFAIKYPSVRIFFCSNTVLNNLGILIHRGKNVRISKVNDPEIHLSISYPRLVHALESYVLSVGGNS